MDGSNVQYFGSTFFVLVMRKGHIKGFYKQEIWLEDLIFLRIF